MVLRLLTLKHIKNWSYEEVEREVRANPAAAVSQLLPDAPDGSRILAITYDTGERYLSTPLWD